MKQRGPSAAGSVITGLRYAGTFATQTSAYFANPPTTGIFVPSLVAAIRAVLDAGLRARVCGQAVGVMRGPGQRRRPHL
jgi:hypothetical protein